MKENQFAPLTDEMFDLFISCIKSGFTEPQAFELTKAYCSVAFVNQALNINRVSKRELADRLRKRNEIIKEKINT